MLTITPVAASRNKKNTSNRIKGGRKNLSMIIDEAAAEEAGSSIGTVLNCEQQRSKAIDSAYLFSTFLYLLSFITFLSFLLLFSIVNFLFSFLSFPPFIPSFFFYLFFLFYYFILFILFFLNFPFLFIHQHCHR